MLNTPPSGQIIACVEQFENNTDSDVISECSGDVAGKIFERAGRQLAGVGFISLINNGQVLSLFTHLLPLPVILFLTGLASLTVAIFPRAINNVEITIRSNPMNMALTGLFILLLGVGITVGCLVILAYASVLGLILFPFYLALLAIFVVFLLSGWVTLTLTIGNWINRRFSQTMMPPMIATAVGGVALTIVLFAISLLPVGNIMMPVIMFVLVIAGLGGSFATRLGRRSYLNTTG